MAESVTIVMYHYVRDLARSRYPAIRGLDLALFREQLAYIGRYYTVVTAEDLVAAVIQHREMGTWDLPRNALLLTFDDGYRDHRDNVFPLLVEAGMRACFFPPVQAVRDGRMLDVNKIHFVLAACPDRAALVRAIFAALDARREEFGLEPNAALYARLAQPSRHWSAEDVFIKRALQVALPHALRQALVDELFRRYVTADEAAFAAELYMTVDDLRHMAAHGMYVGSHADTHPWLGQLPPEAQAREIDRSLELLREVGTPLDDWVMCYPYGNANDSLLDVLRARRCAVGLTTQVEIATSELDPLLLPRIDTNDLPKRAAAEANLWTRRVLAV